MASSVDELTELVVKLTGDATKYMGMLTEAAKSTEATAKKVEQTTSRIEAFGKGLEGFGASAMNALATVGLGLGLLHSFQVFEEGERNLRKLSTAMAMNGGNVEAGIRDYRAFARELSSTTTLGQGEVLGLLRQAETMGMSGEAAQKATKFALGFAEATGTSTEHAIMMYGQMQRGNVHMLRHVQSLRGIHSETELVAKANQLAQLGQKQLDAEFLTAGGQMKKLQQSFTGLVKDIGGMIAEVLNPMVRWLQQAIEAFNSLDPTVRKTVVTVLLLTATILPLMQLLPYIKGVLGQGSMAMTAITMATAMWSAVSSVFLFTVLIPWNIALGLATFLLNSYWVATNLATAVTNLFKLSLMGLWKTITGILTVSGIGVMLLVIAGIITGLVQGMTNWSDSWKTVQAVAVAVWGKVKEAVATFAVWAAPIWKAWLGVVNAGWELIKAAVVATFSFIRGVITGAWQSISGGATTDWEKVKEVAMDVLIGIEYGLRHARDVAELVWAWVKSTFFDYVSKPILTFFMVTLPGLFGSVTDSAQEQLDETSQRLQDEYATLQNSMATSFGEFREQRLREIAQTGEEAARVSEVAGERVGSGLTRGMEKEAHKFNAVIIGSAEQVAHLAEYMDKLKGLNAPGAAEAPQRALTAPLEAATNLVNDLLENLSGSFGDLGAEYLQMGRDFWNGITSVARTTWNFIRDSWNAIPRYAQATWEVITTAGVNALREWTMTPEERNALRRQEENARYRSQALVEAQTALQNAQELTQAQRDILGPALIQQRANQLTQEGQEVPASYIFEEMAEDFEDMRNYLRLLVEHSTDDQARDEARGILEFLSLER